jgi:hypothetical protein
VLCGGPGGLYFLGVDATYHDYDIYLVDRQFKGQHVTALIRVRKDTYLMGIKGSLMLYDRRAETTEAITLPEDKIDMTIRAVKVLTEGASYIVRTDRALYLVDFMRNEGERVTQMALLQEDEGGENTDTLLVERLEGKLLISTTQTTRIDAKSSKHKFVQYIFDLL